jgi:hypothetical protein
LRYKEDTNNEGPAAEPLSTWVVLIRCVFRDPKMKLLYIFGHIVRWYSRKLSPYASKNGRYLRFRSLKWPLISDLLASSGLVPGGPWSVHPCT